MNMSTKVIPTDVKDGMLLLVYFIGLRTKKVKSTRLCCQDAPSLPSKNRIVLY